MIMISRAMKLKNVHAADIMLPIDEVVMVEEKSSINDYREVFAGEGFSRIPVYRGNRNNVIGILSIHNLIRADDPREGKLVLNPPYVIPEDALLIKVLYHMRIHGCHMALISSSGGQLVGMLTLEDILERLVGAIADEFH
jgi:CBS domain containing-hemolysin-like protein